MATLTREEIESKVLETLVHTPYAPSSLRPLSGGTANFIYHATLKSPLADGTKEVLIKHSEGYIANSPAFKLTLSRCKIEEECLGALAKFPIEGKADIPGEASFVVRTPKLYHYDGQNNTQIQEILLNGKDLKTYALQTFTANTPEPERPLCLQLGRALGRWLRKFHDWSATETGLRDIVTQNVELQQLKHMINFSWLLDRVEQFPSILEEAKDVFEEVKAMAARELQDESKLQVIHGDFWTGNILLPDAPIQGGADIPLFVIDWEMSQVGVPNLDVGQMIAELYEMKLYKDITAGLWIVEGFVQGYGRVSDDFAFRTAIQVGAHLISFGTSVQGWGTPEQVETVARTGRDIILHAWRKDGTWFESSDLACLFKET
ncbi:kinase-like domain-containing protein [Poronia punctata]|nr:kinase-like domain-containing protein [Poronia punctata]